MVGNESVLCNRLKMDQQKTAKGTFVKTFPDVGLNGRKVRGQHEEQSALTSSEGLTNSSQGRHVRSGRFATGRDRRLTWAETEEDAQGLLSQTLVNPAEKVLLLGLSQGRFYAEAIADEEQVGAPGGGATGRGVENPSAAQGRSG